MGPQIELVVAEIFVLFAFAVVFVLARLFSRYLMVGWRGYQVDDYLSILLLAVWGASAWVGYTFTIVAQGRHTSVLTPEQRNSMPVAERMQWEYGSKIFLTGLIGYVVIVWLVKLNQLFFYKRLVRGLWVEKTIYPVMGLLAVTFTAIILTITLHCRPFHKVWQVYPDPGPNCVPQTYDVFTVILSLNLTSDFCILTIPIPALRSIQIALTKRIGLWLLFSLGSLCMVFAILRYVYVFQLGDSEGISASWSTREAFVATFVGQAPMIYPLFTKRLWAGRKATTTSMKSYGLHNSADSRHIHIREEHEMRGFKASSATRSTNRGDDHDGPYGASAATNGGHHHHHHHHHHDGPNEEIDDKPLLRNGILVERSVAVEHSYV